MGFLDRLTTNGVPDQAAVDEVEGAMAWSHLAEQLDQAYESLDLMREELAESMVDVELSLEDRTWRSLGVQADDQLSRQGIAQAAKLCRVMAVVNPLIKRGLNLRTAYVWSGGVQINARATGQSETNTAEQDVNSVVQEFLDDPSTRKVLTSAEARETNERALGTDGMLAFALFVKPTTGRVQPRDIPTDEITDIICNPDDACEVWFYKRVHARTTINLGTGAPITDQVTTFYPDIDYRPRGARPVRVNDVAIMWDAPIIFVKVNALKGWDFGIGDAFAAIPWARAYKELLEDWAKLVKSLSRFAWRQTSSTKGRAEKVAGAYRAAAPGVSGDTGVGAVAVGGPGMGSLEAIPKSGATIDAGAGRPLAAMVAAGLDVPVTMLLADPGVTGARATAETLDRPTEDMATMRRAVWSDFHRRLLDFVVDQAVKAPGGALKGTVARDEWGREVVTLAGDTPRTIELDWPDLTEIDLKDLVAAIVDADSTGKLPPLTTVKLLLQALGVDDVDELLDEVTDANGNWVDPAASAGQAAADAFRQGQDPAAALA